MPFLEVVPKREEVTSPRTGWIADRWLKWLTTLRDAVNAAPQREIPTVRLAAQTGPASGTLPAAPLPAGVYRVSVCVSTGGTATVGYVLRGVSRTVTIAGGGSAVVQVDQGSAITYAVAAPTPYDAGVCLERVEA